MDLELTRIFVKVAQNGSFSRAAEILRLPKSTVSKAVSKLERDTGTKLIVRTTRSLTLTQAGRQFYASSLGPILQLEDAQRSLYGQDDLLTGTLRITAPEDLGSYVIAPSVAELSKGHPDLSFELVYTNDLIDLVKDGFDMAVRLGPIKDSALKLKRVGEVVLCPVASPKYLKGADKIKQPADLRNHTCLSLIYKSTLESWTLRSSKGKEQIEIRPKVISNQMTSLLQMALCGGGVALVPTYVSRPYIESGKLIHVLPEWSTPGVPVSIVTPLAPSASARLKVTVAHIQAALTSALRANCAP